MVKNPPINAGDVGSIPGLGSSPGGRHGNPLQYSCLENPHEQRSLVGYSPWGHQESDTTAQLSIAHYKINFHKQILRPEVMLIIHLAEQEEVLRKRN